MKGRSAQLALAIAAMAVIGSVYGWSSTADVLTASGHWSTKKTGLTFVTLAVGIGIGVGISGVLLTRLQFARTIALGLALCGLAGLLLSQTEFQPDFGQITRCLALLGGTGVGIAECFW
jgi:hypothetical protein